jgi:regulator of protease activity HflC (stomatin/prohibitin superfamily)
MIFTQVLSTLGWIVILGLLLYAASVVIGRNRGTSEARLSMPVVVTWLLVGIVLITLSFSLVVINAGEVGVVFNAINGTREEPLNPGLHFVIPFVETVYRYNTQEQVYTMTKVAAEGQVTGDDSLWSPTSEGLQVGIDSSTRYKLNPARAAHIHNSLRDYENVLVRPTIRSIVRLNVSQNKVTDVYGPKRAQIQAEIEEQIRTRFEKEGLLLLSFDIRNVNFTEDYATAIEQKQIAQQQAEQMQFTLQREQQEAERKRIEAEGIKQSAVIKAQGDAESLRLISEQLANNDNLLVYRYIEKLAPNISVMLLPSGSPFLVNLDQLKGQVPAAQPATVP